MKFKFLLLLWLWLWLLPPQAGADLLIPMDLTQTEHLRAYGMTYHILETGREAWWLLNYRGGSFLVDDTEVARREAAHLGVTIETSSGSGKARF